MRIKLFILALLILSCGFVTLETYAQLTDSSLSLSQYLNPASSGSSDDSSDQPSKESADESSTSASDFNEPEENYVLAQHSLADIQFKPEELDQLPDLFAQMDQEMLDLEQNVNGLERLISSVENDIYEIQDELQDEGTFIGYNLEQYASQKVDVSTKERVQGINYDVDIFAHSKQLNGKERWERLREYIYGI